MKNLRRRIARLERRCAGEPDGQVLWRRVLDGVPPDPAWPPAWRRLDQAIRDQLTISETWFEGGS